ncbi:MAG: hypothetical protein H6835_16455 [Planctomycetes bacterium]|nr:hypothetical protein [Planctomycetota bacterium]
MNHHSLRLSRPSFAADRLPKALLRAASLLAMALAWWGHDRSPQGDEAAPVVAAPAAVVPTGGENEARDVARLRQREILDAIRQVECGGGDVAPDGDGGAAIGPYQIHRAYWSDAVQVAPELGGCYEDCRDRAYAERIVAAYMTRYCRSAWQSGDAETVARIHNGGPKGCRKQATIGYWQRVQRHLDESAGDREVR